MAQDFNILNKSVGIPEVNTESDLPDSGSAGQKIIVGGIHVYEWNTTVSDWVRVSDPPQTEDNHPQTETAPVDRTSTSDTSNETQIDAVSEVSQTQTSPTERTAESTPLMDPIIEST